jgi:hypothetical protein
MIYSQNLNVFTMPSNAAFCTMQTRVHEIWARFFGTSLKDDLTYTIADCFRTFPFPVNYETDAVLERTGAAYNECRAAVMIARNEGLTKTYNRFHRPTEKSADIVKLRALHAEMDAAVLRAYGWDDVAQSAKAEFLELPTDPGKKSKYRLFWASEVQDEVLKRLMALNAERTDAEKRAGLGLAAVAEAEEIDGELEDYEDDEDEGDDA